MITDFVDVPQEVVRAREQEYEGRRLETRDTDRGSARSLTTTSILASRLHKFSNTCAPEDS